MARRNHLGHRLVEIKVALGAAPSTTVSAHGLDVTKVIYFHWFISNSGESVHATHYQTGSSIARTVAPLRVEMDATNFTIELASTATSAAYITFNIILED